MVVLLGVTPHRYLRLVERHEIEIIRRSVVMAQDSPTPLPAPTILALIAALDQSEAELRRLREGVQALLDKS